jgi:formylglycine-generating enzyme required for sulfatase activity
MGDDGGRPDERPAHAVSVGPFWAAAAPVTNEEYDLFLAATGREPPRFRYDPRFSDPSCPVVGISWFMAVEYCQWLSRETGRRFRLPTEAEREFAARGGLEGAAWPWGDEHPESRPELAEVCALERTHTPTSLCANGYGLMCMADNVHEWCSDWYDAAYYAVSPAEDPRGPVAGRRRASRGGAWRHQVKYNRCSARSSLDPTFEYNDYGFRVYADA